MRLTTLSSVVMALAVTTSGACNNQRQPPEEVPSEAEQQQAAELASPRGIVVELEFVGGFLIVEGNRDETQTPRQNVLHVAGLGDFITETTGNGERQVTHTVNIVYPADRIEWNNPSGTPIPLRGKSLRLRGDKVPITGMPGPFNGIPNPNRPPKNWNNKFLMAQIGEIAKKGNDPDTPFPLVGDWQTKLNGGRFELLGGSVSILSPDPSEPLNEKALWEFREFRNDGPSGPLYRTQAITNRLIYENTLHQNDSLLEFYDPQNQDWVFRLKPDAKNRIEARIESMSDSPTIAARTLPIGRPHPHYASLFKIIDGATDPPVVPYYLGPARAIGAYCVGGWWP